MNATFFFDTFAQILGALPTTLEVWSLSVVSGAILAAGITALRLSGSRPLSWIANAYVFVFRGCPLIVQLFAIYYGLSSIAAVRASIFWPLLRDAVPCAVFSLALCTAAYQSEIFRGALLAVPAGQIEAAKACGMSAFQRFRRIVFPIALRSALPAYSTEVISMTKVTAVVSLVTIKEMMFVALKIRNDTLVTYTPLLAAGAIYFLLNFLIARGFLALEWRLTPHLRPRAQGPLRSPHA